MSKKLTGNQQQQQLTEAKYVTKIEQILLQKLFFVINQFCTLYQQLFFFFFFLIEEVKVKLVKHLSLFLNVLVAFCLG